MDGGVRETICTRCVHRKVCRNVEIYLEFLKQSENYMESFRKILGLYNLRILYVGFTIGDQM